MRRAAAVLAAAGALAGGAPAAASASTVPVHIEFQAFDPSSQDVLPGETVDWSNVSSRKHTVTADDGTFDSGDLFGGDHFRWKFDTVGAYTYHCRIHPVMTGEIDVRRVTLRPLPPGLVPTGHSFPVSGRTADAAVPVNVQRSTGGSFQTVATATPAPDGTWKANVTADKTADYRAVAGTDVSETRRLLVSDRRVKVRLTRHGVGVTVTPAFPYGRVTLELYRRERFGWWPAKRTKLDYLSEASFRVRGPVRARVVLTESDGWTPQAVSRVVKVRRRTR